MLPLRPIIGKFPRMPASPTNIMDRLPDEVILQIVSYLHIADIVHLQLVSSRYLALARDNAIWKTECFNQSTAEAWRLRQHRLNVQDASLAELRNAVAALPGGHLAARNIPYPLFEYSDTPSTDPVAEARLQKTRALANWEPAYPNEKLDYYEEYIHRHGAINVGWLDVPNVQVPGGDEVREATGAGLLLDHQDGSLQRAVAPLDDGSICIWDLSARLADRSGGGGRLIAQSKPGLLTGRPCDAVSESHAIMTETGAVECVSIDNSTQKGFFAVQNHLQEVDLNTLQITSTKEFPFPITALSECGPHTPVTVGTNMTIHLHDPRDPTFVASSPSSSGELIGGSLYSHATLAQPGPLSILNHSPSSILVAGRFTSLLHYDRRFFPRLHGTIHSGARIANLSLLPHPFIPRHLDLQRNPTASLSAHLSAKSTPGSTLLAAAEYKGKGSLELYSLPTAQTFYHNRQTASASKLLSVAPHGGRIVFSDGDGNLKWVERDGFSHVRTYNINSSHAPASEMGIWDFEAIGQGDIVQKIVPLEPGRAELNQRNLLLWTGDGRLGVLGFGRGNPLGEEKWHDAVEEQAQSAEQRAREDAEKQYAERMRRALEGSANEARFVRGLGMGFRRN